MTDMPPVVVTDAPRWTDWIPVADLQPAPRNAKDHDQGVLGASVDAFGYVEPVVIDERTGKLLSGHGRAEYLTAQQAAGAPPPEGVMVGDDGRWRVMTVRGVRSRDDAHAEAMVIALNRVGERGGWKQDMLADSLDSLVKVDPALLDAAGFTPDQLNDLLATVRAPSLDDLAGKYGAHDPANLWPVLRFKIPPADRDRYLRLVEGLEGGDDVLFRHLLERAERP